MSDNLLEMKECAKLAKTTEKSQPIADFIEWLKAEKGIILCEIVNIQHNEPIWQPVGVLLAEYFQIDMRRVEDERRAMLQHLKDKTTANVQEMQRQAFSLGKNHKELF